MRKGLATETIAKLLILLFVVGIVVYIIYRYVLNSPLGEQECRARMTTWCANCEFTKWQGGGSMGEKLENCAITVYKFATKNTCDQTECAGFLP